MMTSFLTSALCLAMSLGMSSVPAAADSIVNSPHGIEVRSSYEAEFETSSTEPAPELMLGHAKFLYGYFQNHSQVEAFGIAEGVDGIGAPSWPPKLTLISSAREGTINRIRYRFEGRLILHKKAARRMLANRSWKITLPFDVDHFFIKECADWDNNTVEDFWYSYDPFKKGCESLSRPPLASEVLLTFTQPPPIPHLFANFAQLRGHGQKRMLIASVDGYDTDAMGPNDAGVKSYEAANEWLRSQGFKEKVIAKHPDWTIHQFDKVFTRADGTRIPVRIERFLGEAELEEPNSVMFSRFLIHAIAEADAIIYDGHSGFGLNLSVPRLEARAGLPVVFNNSKHQLFFFDSCSSYSYFLSVFIHKKAPGTLDFLSNGLETITDFGFPVEKVLYRYLFDVNEDHPNWNRIMRDMEVPLHGRTFLLNVSRLLPDAQDDSSQSMSAADIFSEPQ